MRRRSRSLASRISRSNCLRHETSVRMETYWTGRPDPSKNGTIVVSTQYSAPCFERLTISPRQIRPREMVFQSSMKKLRG